MESICDWMTIIYLKPPFRSATLQEIMLSANRSTSARLLRDTFAGVILLQIPTIFSQPITTADRLVHNIPGYYCVEFEI